MNKIQIKNAIENKFFQACKVGDLETVETMTTDLTAYCTLLNEDYKLDYFILSEGFRWSCLYGHLPLVRYFLTHDNPDIRVSIHTNNDSGFYNACKEGHLEVVQYLLESPELKEHINIFLQNEQSIHWIISRKQQHILEYFIFQLNIFFTKSIKEYIEKNIQDEDWIKKIYQLFENKEQYHSLKNKLPQKLELEDKLVKL